MKKKSKSAKRSKSSKVAKSSAVIEAPAPAGNEAEATKAAAAVPATPKKSPRPRPKRATKKTATRYSPKAKAEIVQFVREHDLAKGRGGKSAAVRQFGVSALTLSNWIKASKGSGKAKPGKSTTASRKRKSALPASAGIEGTLVRMLQIRTQIDALKAEFEDLKTRI